MNEWNKGSRVRSMETGRLYFLHGLHPHATGMWLLCERIGDPWSACQYQSSLELAPEPIVARPSAAEFWSRAMDEAFPSRRSLIDTAKGCVRWQLDDPKHRRLNLSLQGHTMDAWATVVDGGAITKHVKFTSPVSSAEAHRTLDESFGLSCDDAGVVVARNPQITFLEEDTGSID